MKLGILLLLAVLLQVIILLPGTNAAPNRILMRFGKRSTSDVLLADPSELDAELTADGNGAEVIDDQSFQQHPVRIRLPLAVHNGVGHGYYLAH